MDWKLSLYVVEHYNISNCLYLCKNWSKEPTIQVSWSAQVKAIVSISILFYPFPRRLWGSALLLVIFLWQDQEKWSLLHLGWQNSFVEKPWPV